MQILELNPDDTVAKKSLARLQPIVRERQEKMKDEMLGTSALARTAHLVCLLC